MATNYEYLRKYETKVQKTLLKRKDLIYPELSYQIMGVLFKVSKELGSGYLEKHYQRALNNVELKRSGLKFKEQVPIELKYQDTKIGKYFLDFLIEDKVILEIKNGRNFSNKNIEQVLGYLKAFNLSLGILANFTANGVAYKRIVNAQ